MGYKPSLRDIESIYSPNLADLEAPISASKQLVSQAQSMNQPTGRYINPYEEYSNPTQYQGFEELPQKEKLARIAFSQFDPANQTPLGTMVPPGAYEHPATRATSEMLAYSLLPNQPFKGAGLGKYISNALSRTGGGTALGTGLEMANPESKSNIEDSLLKNALLNAGMEGLTLPFRGASKFAELVTPKQSAKNELKNIQQAYQDSVSAQTSAYQHPDVIRNNENIIALNPVEFLNDIGVKKKKLLSDSKDLYDKFLSKPNFENLHDLQSQINKDATGMSKQAKPYTKAALTKWGRALKKETYNALEHDPAALAQYKLGDKITKEQVKPFEKTQKIRNIIEGRVENVEPSELSSYIKSALEKYDIPKGHYLRKSLSGLENEMHRGEALKGIIPEKIRGYIHNIPGYAQNPYIAKIIKEQLSPLYYGAGKGLIGYNLEE